MSNRADQPTPPPAASLDTDGPLHAGLRIQPSVFTTMEQTKNFQPTPPNQADSQPHALPQTPPATVDELVGSVAQMETDEQRAKRERLERLRSRVVSLGTLYPPDDDLLEVCGERCFARKELIAIKAKAKNGKSTLEMIFVAALLNGGWGRVRRLAGACPRILFIDTEMKMADTQLINRKAMRMAGLPESADLPQVTFYNLRSFTAPECRQALDDLLELVAPDIVFIDGIVDMLHNFNDLEGSQALVRELLALAEAHNCCIVSVLHTNKSIEDQNMRGHLGSFLVQKASLVFHCRKEDNFIRVSCSESRHAPIPDFTFTFDSEGNPISADEMLMTSRELERQKRQEEKRMKKEAEEAEQLNAIKQILFENDGRIKQSQLASELKDRLNCAINHAYLILRKLRARKLIVVEKGFISLSEIQ